MPLDGNLPTIFTFTDGSPVRTILRGGVVWFFLTDVCAVLGHTNPSVVAGRLDNDEKATLSNVEGGNFNGLGVIGAMPTLINESGLYSLILTSRKPQAKAFKKWITSVVLPALRKDGAYVVGEESMDEDTLILRAHEALQRKVERLAVENKMHAGQIYFQRSKYPYSQYSPDYSV